MPHRHKRAPRISFSRPVAWHLFRRRYPMTPFSAVRRFGFQFCCLFSARVGSRARPLLSGLLLLLSLLLPQLSWADFGFQQNYVLVRTTPSGAATAYYTEPTANEAGWQGANLGTFAYSTGGQLRLVGAGGTTSQYDGAVVNAMQLRYRVYAVTDSSAAFSTLSLPAQGAGSGTGSLRWGVTTTGVDLLAQALQPGRYVVDLYFQAQATSASNSSFARSDNRGGANYRATFTIADEGQVIDSTEIHALRAFYLSTNGSRWDNHAGWPATDSAWAQATVAQAAGWFGVSTAGGDVTGLNYYGNEVGGFLPPAIGQLLGLRSLQIERNHYCCPNAVGLGGTLPKELGQLLNLQSLIIALCDVSGPIPPELGQLSQLRTLTLFNNQLSGAIPPELGNLTQLTTLSLDNYYRLVLNGHRNTLTGGIPPALGKLRNLTSFALDLNSLGGGIPPELGQLTQLQYLELDNDQLTGAVPAGLLALPQLRILLLGAANNWGIPSNTLSGLPDPRTLSNLAGLRLVLGYNQFDFGALEPYFSAPGQLLTAPGSSYLPQSQDSTFLAPDTLLLTAEQPAHLDGQLAGTHNLYQWQRQVGGQWQDVSGQTQAQLAWSSLAATDAGLYRARVTNTLVTDLTLYSPAHNVQVRAGRNLPNDTNQSLALRQPHAPVDSATVKPLDMNYVRTWVPRVALRTLAPSPPVATLGQGLLLREQWSNAPGLHVADIPVSTPPTSTGYVLSLQGPSRYGDYYGDRLRGYLTAPQTGKYVLAIAGNDDCELWLSTDASPAHKLRRAWVNSFVNLHDYNQYQGQQSDSIALVAGQRYYVEVLHKENRGGGDHLEVAWTLPDGAFQDPIPGTVLTPYVPLTVAATGGVLREEWNSLAGYTYQLTDIPLTTPINGLSYLTSLEKGTPVGDSYGDRIRGYLVPQTEGDYTFWIAGDHQCGLWVSTDSLPAHLPSNPTALVSDHSDPRQWERVPGEQRSPQTLHLVAGQRYYLEVQHKEQGGNNTVAVAWQRTGGPFEGPIPGQYLAPYLGDYPARFGTAPGPLASLGSNWTVDSASISTQYLDGLGRPVQTVLHQASPQRRDLVQVQAYDGLGREPRAYLPYAADTAGTGRLGYHGQPLTQQQQFYLPSSQQGPPAPGDPTTGVARTGAAYAETQFEASPLNRVLAQGSAGEAWQLAQGHVSKRLERANTAADSVLYFQPGYSPTSLDPGYQGFYLPGELWGTLTTDTQGPAMGGNGYQTITWKDRLGRVVLKQVEAARAGRSGASRWLRTAYAYDDAGHLRFVLPPEATRRVLTQPILTVSATGYILREVWANIGGGTTVDQLPLGGQPTSVTQLTSLEDPTNMATQYGDRIRGYLVAPQTGSYTFWVAGDDESELYLSTSQDPAAIQRIARVPAPGRTLPREWTKYAQQQSASINLVAGQRYYIEVRHKQGDGDDNLAVTWQLPDGSQYGTPIAGAYLAPLTPPLLGLSASQLAAIQPYLFHYRYDARERQIAKQVPGQDGETLVVYDQLDRPVLSQDAQQRSRKEWSWNKYDVLGRVVLTGLVTRTDTAGQVTLQAQATADTAVVHQYEQRSADGTSYPQYYTTRQAFPRLGAAGQQGFGAGLVLSASYYDDYDFDNDGQPNAHYSTLTDAAFAAGQAPVADEARVTGMATHTLTRVLNRPAADPGVDWLQATSFYDERGRIIQTQSINARDSLDVVTMRLDFLGKPVQTVARHGGPSHTPVQVVETTTYDHAERLRATRQQLPGEASPALLSRKHYNELGQLTVDSLATGRLSQNVKYAYNIRGWLTSLNNPYSPDPADLFNLSLHYEQGFTAGYEQYNGNLTGQTWRGRDGVQRAQGYGYDPLNRVLQGDYVARAGGSTGTLATATPWNQEADNFRLCFVSYDDNGNILTLRRQGLLQAATSRQTKQYGAVDNLTYAYQGNRLQAVNDAVSGNQVAKPASYHGAPTSLAGDFQEGGVHQGQEYMYDANGNLTQDKNKGITGILYNHLNLPRQIHFGQVGDSVVFRYAASGQKVAKLVYQTGKPLVRTDYLGPYQYEQDNLLFFPHAAGRVLRFVSKDPAGQATVSYQREFTVKDHLGNLRLAYRAGQRRTYLATLEQDSVTHKREVQQFDSLSVSMPIAVSTTYSYGGGSWAAKLNAGGNQPQPLGPLTQLAVQRGDTLKVSVAGLYPRKVDNNGFAFSLVSFVAGLLQPGLSNSHLIESSKRGGLPLLQIGLSASLANIQQLSGGVPKGYLRVLCFNSDSVLVRQRTWQLSQNALGGFELLGDTVQVSQDGYVSVYVGNESNVDVFFDQLLVEHRAGIQMQENQYDSWGLPLAGINYKSRDMPLYNKRLFNGKEIVGDLGLAWLDYSARLYDSQLGVWHSVDPWSEHFVEQSPYSYVFNNPLKLFDPTGKGPEDPKSTQYSKYSYTYNGKNNHTIVRTTTNVLYQQNKNGTWQRTSATSSVSVSFKTSTNKDGSVKLSYTAASTSTQLKTKTYAGADLAKQSYSDRVGVESFTEEEGLAGTSQASSSTPMNPETAAQNLGVMNGVKVWFDRNGAGSNPFMQAKDTGVSPLFGGLFGAAGEAIKYALGGEGVPIAGAAVAASALIMERYNNYNYTHPEAHAGETMEMNVPSEKK